MGVPLQCSALLVREEVSFPWVGCQSRDRSNFLHSWCFLLRSRCSRFPQGALLTSLWRERIRCLEGRGKLNSQPSELRPWLHLNVFFKLLSSAQTPRTEVFCFPLRKLNLQFVFGNMKSSFYHKKCTHNKELKLVLGFTYICVGIYMHVYILYLIFKFECHIQNVNLIHLHMYLPQWE